MKYWLYTEDYPDFKTEYGTWGIATVKEIDEEVEIISVLVDTTGYLKPGYTDEPYDDSVTEDPHDCVKFIFTGDFWE